MERRLTTVTINRDLIPFIDKVKDERKFKSRSHTVRVILKESPRIAELMEEATYEKEEEHD